MTSSQTLPVLDLGQDSPLDIQGEDHRVVDQKEVSIRWLVASIAIALAGATLIGMSIIIAMKGTRSAVVSPQFVRAGGSISKSHSSDTIKKADKILRSEITVSAKQNYQAPAQIPTVGGGVAIKNRQFIRLSTSLSLRTGVYAANIPRFNAARLLNQEEDNSKNDPVILTEVSDADVSIVRVDLADIDIPTDAPGWTDDEVNALVSREYDYWGSSAFSLPVANSTLTQNLKQVQGSDPLKMNYTPGESNPFTTIDVEVVPENVTQLIRSTPGQVSSFFEERNIIFHRGDSFDKILESFGADSKQMTNIIAALGGRKTLSSLSDGQYVRALFAPLGTKLGEKSLVRVMILGEKGIDAIAAANDRGFFVSVPPPIISIESAADPTIDEEEDIGEGARLYESVHETLAKNDLPRDFADELVRIFGYEIDFQRRVAAGDSIEIFYSHDDDNTTSPELLFAAITLGGDRRPVFRYQAKDASIEYYDPEGRSLKKFLLRKPVAEAVLRSNFGLRFHPILKYSRLHAGVDWSGKTGTPIYAAGNGVIIKAGRSSGYGNRIEIQHANGYVTTYSHQSRFANGIEAGVKVKQGQTIGYIGNTGLSTGPHLHYEVLINGRFVDPMTIKVPRTTELTGVLLTDFREQRDKIIEQIKKTGATSLNYTQAGNF